MVTITDAKLAFVGFVGSTAEAGQTLFGARAFLAGQDVLDPGNTGGNPVDFLCRALEDPWCASHVFLLGFYIVGLGFGVQWLVWAYCARAAWRLVWI